MTNFFEKIIATAKKFKNKAALVINGESFSYEEIIQRSFMLSRQFLKFKDKNSFCVIISDKSINLYLGMLACFFSKSVYIPLNIQSGIEKSKKILASLDSYFIFVGGVKCDVLANLLLQVKNKDILFLKKIVQNELKTIFHDNNCYCIADYAKENLKFNLESNAYCWTTKKENYAYLFFTSGSTGKPKAVPISYKNLSAYINDISSLFPVKSEDRFIQFSDIAFDISIHEIVLCFVSGATLYVYDEKKELSVSRFIYNNKISHCILVPSAMPTMIDQCQFYKCNLSSLRNTFVCGEPFPIVFAQLWETQAPNSMIVNLYGPTEATVSCTYHLYHKTNNYKEMMSLPIGKPFPHTTLLVTEKNELLILGDQVSNGYWPSYTTDKFQYNAELDLMSYFTGDRVSFHDKYGYLFHGRLDDQWQVKGLRVEKHEVESILRKILNCHDICVVPIYNKYNLIQSLIAFSTRKIDIAFFRKKLLPYLSNKVIPTRIVTLESMPYLSNGKIDYRFLQENYHD